MSSHPWMPLYCADFLGDTSHLNAAETGSYLCLLMHLWLNGRLPNDDQKLARIARATPRQWAAMRPTVSQFFDTGWTHKRVLAERIRVAEISSKRRMAVEKRQDRERSFVDTNGLQKPGNYSHSHKDKERKRSAEASASEPDGSPGRPVYTDTRHELWAEGVAILTSLGVPEKSARSNIGRWLKAAGDNAETVLGAIQRARDARAVEPIAWITQAIKPKANGIRHAQEDRSVVGAADRLLDRLRAFDDITGTGHH